MESTDKGCAVIDTKDLPPYVEKVNNDVATKESRKLTTWGIIGLVTLVAMVIVGAVHVVGVYFQNEHTKALIKEFRTETPLGEETIRTIPDEEVEDFELPQQELRVLHDFKRGVTAMRMQMGGTFGCYLKVLNKDHRMEPKTLESYLENGGLETPVNNSSSINETGKYGMVASESTINDVTFLGDIIMDMCDRLHITWLLPNDHEVTVRDKRSVRSTGLSRKKWFFTTCFEVKLCWYEYIFWFKIRVCVTLYKKCFKLG